MIQCQPGIVPQLAATKQSDSEKRQHPTPHGPSSRCRLPIFILQLINHTYSSHLHVCCLSLERIYFTFQNVRSSANTMFLEPATWNQAMKFFFCLFLFFSQIKCVYIDVLVSIHSLCLNDWQVFRPQEQMGTNPRCCPQKLLYNNGRPAAFKVSPHKSFLHTTLLSGIERATSSCLSCCLPFLLACLNR